jgi:hypothetical protein
MNDLEKRFEGYDFEIEIPDKERFDPSVAIVEVKITTPRDGRRYSANVATRDYVPWVFKKNERTGECDNGRWWGKPDNLLYVKEISRENVRTAINGAIKSLEIESYLTEID